MSRYLGPLWRKSRALQFSFLDKKEFSRGKKRTAPPGIHGEKRKRHSIYSLQNREKQKLRFLYGLREKQLRNKFREIKETQGIKRLQGDMGDNLLIDCESRLDNLVLRSRLASTLRCARQWVSHGHFLVNNKKTKSPAYELKPGQVISFRKEQFSNNKLVKENLARNLPTPPYISIDKNLTITYLRKPLIEDKEIAKVKEGINTSLVAEWYNRKV